MAHDLEMKREKRALGSKKKEIMQLMAQRGSRPKRGKKARKASCGLKKEIKQLKAR